MRALKPTKKTMLLTHSSIRAFQTCRRRYQYRYVDGIEPKDRPLYYNFGTAVHLALSKHYLGGKPAEVIAAIEQYFADNAPAQDDSQRLQEWADGRELAIGMFKGYISRYPQESFKVKSIEQAFELPILDVRGVEYDGMRLAGRVDGVVEENGLWILEHKTAKTIDGNYKRRLTLDPQSMIYLEAMERVLGQHINGIIYNVLAKSVPERPTVLKNGQLSQAKAQNTTPELYRTALAEIGAPEANYADFLAYLEANRREYFYREYLTFSQDERAEWRRELWQIAADIERAGELEAFYKNPQQCVSFGTCPYFDICTAPDREFVIENSFEKRAIHSELEEVA